MLPQPVACTRKTSPGTRALAAKAVRTGGAVMHRLGLSETLLLFPEHRLFLAREEWPAAVAAMRASQPEKRLVAEVGSEDEALALAPAGGVTAANAVAYARAGADLLVTSAPYFAPPADVQVRITAVG